MRLYYILQAHTSDVTCLTQLNDESFASGSIDKEVKIWDSNFKNTATLSQHLGRINAIVFLENKYLITSSNDNFLRIYIQRGIQLINSFKPHSKAVQDIAILDDKNELFATCSVDNEIRIWNSTILIANLSGHQDYVYE